MGSRYERQDSTWESWHQRTGARWKNRGREVEKEGECIRAKMDGWIKIDPRAETSIWR